MMKILLRIPTVFLLAVVVLFTMCKNENKNASTSTEVVPSINNKGANAELSIATGGKWNGRKYEERTSFKNVEQLSVPSQHTDHSYFIRYEGPGWESDKVGYRLYLDWRNAIDIFGKKTEEMILDKVGQDGFDSYHEMSDWGLDILKVGKALGIGSYGRLLNDSVYHFQDLDSTNINIVNSENSSSVHIDYYGWTTENIKTNLTSTLSIEPGSRMTKVNLSNFTPAPGLVTGIVKHNNTELMKGDQASKWNYLATYGQQTIVPDDLGMVIFYKNADVVGTKDGKYDHIIEFASDKSDIKYYFAAAWAGERNGIKNKEEFKNYLSERIQELNN